jgi:hypothetical protein
VTYGLTLLGGTDLSCAHQEAEEISMARKRLVIRLVAGALLAAGWFAGVEMTNTPIVPKSATYAL